MSIFPFSFFLLKKKKKKKGQSPSNGRKCEGCNHHHLRHRHQYHNSPHPHPSYFYHSSFPPPPPSYHFNGNPVSAFNGPSWIPPPYSNTSKGNGFLISYPSGSSSSSSSSDDKADQESHPNVDQKKAMTTTIRNVVNVHRNPIRVEPDEQNPDRSLISFTFDSVVDGSFTVFYFAKEGANCSFSLVYPEFCMPVTVPFHKGVNQKFSQPSGSGIDLRFFRLDELSTPSHGDVYPLVVYAGACFTSLPAESTPQNCAQITEAVLQRSGDGPFQVKVVNQILWVDGNRYELQEIFDLGISAQAEIDDNECNFENECVICMSEPTDTTVLPCRHMCMCTGCAKALNLQSNKCPICRQPVEKIMELPNPRKTESTSNILHSGSL